MPKKIARTYENELLEKIYKNRLNKSLLVGIDGRRRVGKTTFVKDFIDNKIEKLKFNGKNIIDKDIEYPVFLNFIGNANKSSTENIISALNVIKNELDKTFLSDDDKKNIKKFLNGARKYNWKDFFFYLDEVIDFMNEKYQEKLNDKTKKIRFFIFFDEISWYDKKGSFINEFSDKWNTSFFNKEKLSVFLASSVSTWIQEKVFKNQNSLYSRLNLILKLQPFSLKEIYDFISIEHKVRTVDLIKYYCIFGGIVKYYDMIDFDLSFSENLSHFSKYSHYIEQEYYSLFNGLFSKNMWHMDIMELLSKSKNLTAKEIKHKLSIKNKKVHDPDLYCSLSELAESGMIKYVKFNGINQYIIQDNFCYFYYYWFLLKNKEKLINNHLFENGYFYNWLGNAFEIVVINNLNFFPFSEDMEMYLNWNNYANENVPHKQIDVLLSNKNKNKFIIIEAKAFSDDRKIEDSYLYELSNKMSAVLNFYKRKQEDTDSQICLIGLNKIFLSEEEVKLYPHEFKTLTLKEMVAI